MHSYYKNGNIYCRAVPNWVLYTRRTHGEATATAAAAVVVVKREEEEDESVVVISFKWFPSDDTLFITSAYNTDIQY